MKIDLEQIHIGVSPLTKEVYAGKLNKVGNKWLSKVNVSNLFLEAVLNYFLPSGKEKTTNIQSGSDKWEVTVKKIM